MSSDDPLLDSIEVVHDDRGPHPFLHCMPCGATFGLHWSPLTVATVVAVATRHVCAGEVDDG